MNMKVFDYVKEFFKWVADKFWIYVITVFLMYLAFTGKIYEIFYWLADTYTSLFSFIEVEGLRFGAVVVVLVLAILSLAYYITKDTLILNSNEDTNVDTIDAGDEAELLRDDLAELLKDYGQVVGTAVKLAYKIGKPENEVQLKCAREAFEVYDEYIKKMNVSTSSLREYVFSKEAEEAVNIDRCDN